MKKVAEEIKQKHEQLLSSLEKNDEGLPDEARLFIKEIGKAGAQVTDRDLRAQLRAIIEFWGDYIHEQTGKWLKVSLEPASLPEDTRVRLSRKVVGAAVILVLVSTIVLLSRWPSCGVGGPTPTPTLLIIVGPPPSPGWTWESCTNEGWIAQTYTDSQGIESVAGSADVAQTGSCSLKLNARLQARHLNLSKGEAYIELSAPWSFDGVTISCWVYVPPDNATGPPSSSNGAQLFVKDANYKSDYGSWVHLNWVGWTQITLTPTTSVPPNGGYMDAGFNPNAVVMIGVKIAVNDQSPSDYSYNGPFYVDDCTW